MIWIVDRFEGDFAVLECGEETFSIPKSALPKKLSEGDVLEISKNDEQTAARKKNADAILKDLFGR